MPTAPADPCAESPYALTGPHVEPQASYWMYCARLRLVSIRELTAVTDDPAFACPDADPAIGEAKKCYFPPYPDPTSPAGCAAIQTEFAELVALAKWRDDPCSVAGPDVPGPLNRRRQVSRLFNLQPQALGAVVASRAPGQQVIRTGRGLARAVESETPGLYYRHVLNFLTLRRPGWSPPRQALVWAALDIAIASALQAAWYYKWLSTRPLTARRERPVEYAIRTGQTAQLPILFDHPDELTPTITRCPRIHPGTPRHPAYPSGHSTYAGAASAILRFFFGNDPIPPALLATPASPFDSGITTIGPELDNLADNIGLGRMWAGVHWRSDHTAGLMLGRTVARLVLEQLFTTGNLTLCVNQPAQSPQCRGVVLPCNEPSPPTIPALEQQRQAFLAECDKPTAQPPCGPPALPARQALTEDQIVAEVRRFEAELRLRGAERAAAELQRVGEVVSRLAEEDQALVDASGTVQQGAGPDPEAREPDAGRAGPERPGDVQQ